MTPNFLVESFVGDRKSRPGTVTGWQYNLQIVETAPNHFEVSVTETPDDPANTRNKKYACYFEGNVLRWTSNNAIISPSTCVEYFLDQIPSFGEGRPAYNAEAQKAAYSANANQLMTEYAQFRTNRPISNEERFEATAALGFNQTVVDVISGRSFRTFSKKR